MVLVVAAALVFGIGKLIGTGSDQPADQASTTASTPKSSGASASAGTPLGPAVPEKLHVRATQVPLLPPTGECAADEVSVLPSVPKAAAGGPIVLAPPARGHPAGVHLHGLPGQPGREDHLRLRPDLVEPGLPAARSARPRVVVRSGVPAVVPVTWSGRRSDTDCSHSTQWALPGFYHVYAAALGSTPTDVQFEVTIPNRRLVTARPSRSRSPGEPPRRPTAKPAARPPKATPTAKPPTKSGKGTTCGGDNAAGTC